MKSITLFVTLFCTAQLLLGQTKPQQKIMKQYSLLVRVPVNYSPEQVKAANVQWTALLDKWKAAEVYLTSFPFPGEGYVVSGAQKTVTKTSVVCDELRVVSNLFVLAEDYDHAVEMARETPVLAYGGSVEVREIVGRPQVQKN